MTRREFCDNVTSWEELIDVCNDYDIDACSDVLSDEGYDNAVEEDINDRDCFWADLAGYLNDLPRSYDGYYYVRNGYFDYSELSDTDFDEYKEAVFRELDRYDDFDEDDDEEECGQDEPEEEDVYEVSAKNAKSIDFDGVI